MTFLSRKKRSNPHKSAQAVNGSQVPPISTHKSFYRSPNPSAPDGVKVLHDCPDAIVDICFVHGLTGDRESTWTAPGQSRPWPETLLPPKLPKARILTYGYDAYVIRTRVAGSDWLLHHAKNLLHDLTTERASCNALSRPLIFVAHSMGGLVCKMAILHSQNNDATHLRTIFDCTKGIIFMGTPHRGAWIPNSAKMSLAILTLMKSANKKLVQVLRKHDNQVLQSLQYDFLRMMAQELQRNGRSLDVACFVEGRPLPVIGEVVSKESATFEGHNPFTIHANHRGMVRFASEYEIGFRILVGELRRWYENIGQRKITLSKECLECLESLAFPAMGDRSHDIDNAVAGTCDWLLRHEKYKAWAACYSGLLWIKGKPGSGKSTLLKYALGNQRYAPNATDNDLVLSYFFHGRGDELQRTPLGFYRSLIHQVLRQEPETLTNLVDTFVRKRKEVGEPGEKWQWHENELRRFLESSFPGVLKARPVWLFVDALDECGRDGAVDLFRWLRSLFRALPPTDVQFRVCVTCRHYPILADSCDFEICPELQNEQDISIYVQTRLSESRGLAMSSIPSIITQHASGVFMWARLVVDQALNLDHKGKTLQSIEEKIKSITPELDELYHKLVEDMCERQASLRLIQWICFATRPLTLDELRWAMAVEPDCSHQSLQQCERSSDYIPDNNRFKRRVQTLSCGLAEFILSSNDNTHVVQFIHQSIKDFFVNRGLSVLDDSSNSTRTTVGMAHLQLLKTSVRYLMMDEIGQSTDIPREKWLVKLPLLRYATTSLVTHMKQSDASASHQDVLELFAWPSNVVMQRWTRAYQGVDRLSYQCPQERTSLLHIVAKYRILGVLSTILRPFHVGQATNVIDSGDVYGQTPLSLAAQEGHKDVVELLLATGQVDADSNDIDNHTPLLYAAERGHENVVELLLATGKVDPNSKGINDQTPLLWAARFGYQAIIELLLATGRVDPDPKDIFGYTPLLRAIQNGHEAVVELLLATGKVDPDSEDNIGRTPLSWAAGQGRKYLVQLLLATGKVDPDSKDVDSRTPLSWASGEGHKDVVRLLLATGQVDPNSKDVNSRTPQSWAAGKGYNDVSELLLATGKVDAVSHRNQGRIPLLRISRHKHVAVVEPTVQARPMPSS